MSEKYIQIKESATYQLDVETILPFGDNLRPLIANSTILTDSDLKNFLAQKGVFTSSSDRKDTIPLLSMSLLSPNEFEQLREKQSDKEATKKRRNRQLEWKSKEDLHTVLKQFSLPIENLVDKKSANYRILNFYRLSPVDGNKNY
ncbi:hypothetical protein ACOI1C_21470 [Bacillus sp. DJP31]|uniref:hypothetical protein n=1 Tax=Bacillus sp. DJP31 TaxID=3409789 RepID=UPI003BB56448